MASLLPLRISPYTASGKNGKGGLSNAEWKYQYNKKRPEQDPGTQRLSEIDKSKMDQVPDMIRRGVRHGLNIEYVLFDSWFTLAEGISKSFSPCAIVHLATDANFEIIDFPPTVIG